MLTKEDRNELKELSQLKEQLSQKEDFLEQLAETKDSVSAERYEQLETSYRESIDTLCETIKNLTERYRHKQDESKIQLSSLEKRREKTAGEQKEITLLKGKKAISEDDFKNQNSEFSKQLNRLDKEINILKTDMEEIDFYLNAKGDVKFKRSILEQYDVLPLGAVEGAKSKAAVLFSKIKKSRRLSKKMLFAFIIVLVVATVLIGNGIIGRKISSEVDNYLSQQLRLLNNLSDDDISLTYTYSNVKVNPLLSTIKINDVTFSYIAYDEVYQRRRWQRVEAIELGISIGSVRARLPFRRLKRMFDSNQYSLDPFRISYNDIDVKYHNYEDNHEHRFSAKKLSIGYKGSISNLSSLEADLLLSQNQEVALRMEDFRVSLDNDLRRELRSDDEVFYAISGLGLDSNQLESLAIKIRSNNYLMTIKGKAKTHGFDVSSDFELFFNRHDLDENPTVKKSNIEFSNVSSSIERFIPILEEETGLSFVKKGRDKWQLDWVTLEQARESQLMESHVESIIADLNNLCAMAYQFYIRPRSMGGGGGTYEGFDVYFRSLPSHMKSNSSATYTCYANDVSNRKVRIKAISNRDAKFVRWIVVDSNGNMSIHSTEPKID